MNFLTFVTIGACIGYTVVTLFLLFLITNYIHSKRDAYSEPKETASTKLTSYIHSITAEGFIYEVGERDVISIYPASNGAADVFELLMSDRKLLMYAPSGYVLDMRDCVQLIDSASEGAVVVPEVPSIN